MPTAPDHPEDQRPVAEAEQTRVAAPVVGVFRPLDEQAQKDFGRLMESSTNRWRVQQS